jgi:hypothetical protein
MKRGLSLSDGKVLGRSRERPERILAFALALITMLAAADSSAQGTEAVRPPRPAEGIQDNSFLVEEAYNQEPGVVQHILNVVRDINTAPGPDDHDWHLVFTQEWPLFSQRHQLSYTVPYSFLHHEGQAADGLGNVFLNYRYQAMEETAWRPALAPRFSLLLPTGNTSAGLGYDTLGYQFALPLSKVVHDRWSVHANAGLTLFPGVQNHDLWNYYAGASLIYAVSPNFNLLTELVGWWNEDVNATGALDRQFQAVVSPGVRYAFNLAASQLVLGLGAPIGLTRTAPDVGVVFYLSFEHRFRRLP